MSHSKPSPAMVVACLALFVALSGTAVALKRGEVGPRAIRTEAVRTSKIKDRAVTTQKIAPGAINSSLLSPNSVGTSHLADNAVIQSKIAADAVDSNQIAPGAVGPAKLRSSSVTSGKIEDGAVTAAKLAADSVTSASVLNGSLTTADIATATAVVSFDPPNVNNGACAVSGDLAVAGMQTGDALLLFPDGAGTSDWPVDFLLGAYGPSGPGSVRVELCNEGPAPVNPGPVTLTALIFR
jgi:hypothetical protein